MNECPDCQKLLDRIALMNKLRRNDDKDAGGLLSQLATLTNDRDRYREALNAAARSLNTIATLAGKDEYLSEMAQVRGYARNRSDVAALSLSPLPETEAERKGGRRDV